MIGSRLGQVKGRDGRQFYRLPAVNEMQLEGATGAKGSA